MAHFRAHAGGGNNHFSASARNRGIHIGHAVAVSQGSLGVGDGLGIFRRSDTFTGEGGLLNFKGCRNKKAAIRRNTVARLHQHNVSRHQLLGLNLNCLAIAAHTCDAFHGFGQRRQAGLSFGLTTQSQDRVEDSQPDQHQGGFPFSGEDLVDDGRAE